ncbi:MAG TPA: preprotein translocase subunit SecE [Ktedonobacteraceae bacterium]|nr:preprotein translocase subunit SecE [Ktedonobacteraceae bacterium]
MANKMADKKKNASQGGMIPASARSEEKEQSKNSNAIAREREEKEQSKNSRAVAREERKVRETKTVRSASSSKQSSSSTRFRNNRIVRFVREAYYELRYKVTWPTFEEARNMTFVVIALSAAVGLLLGLADLGLFQLFKLITGG